VFIFSDYHLVQGEETRVGRIKILDKKLELEPDYLRIFEKPLGHFQRIIIVRVIRRETIEIFIFLKDFYVPSVLVLPRYRHGGRSWNTQLYRRLLASDARCTPRNNIDELCSSCKILAKGIPKGIKKLIRKQMYMEIDYFFGKHYHKQDCLVHYWGMILFIILTFLFCQIIGVVGLYTKNELAG